MQGPTWSSLDSSTLLTVLFRSTDIGQALSLMLEDDNTASQTYELYGPYKLFNSRNCRNGRSRNLQEAATHQCSQKFIMQPSARLLNDFLWWHTTSADEVEREFLDQVIDPTAKTFKDLGMQTRAI